MALHLQVVCTDSRVPLAPSEERRLQVIGEILPFVLAKYGAQAFRRPQQEREPRKISQRFKVS